MTRIATLPFVKMHGAGNDYILVNDNDVRQVHDMGALSRAMSHRCTGVGADGLIVVRPSSRAAARMEMYNSDGSRSAMCGNGLRLVAKFLADRGHVNTMTTTLESDAGLHFVEYQREVDSANTRQAVTGARISMGAPIADPARIPLRDPKAILSTSGFPTVDLTLDAHHLTGTCLSVGNPHCVVFVENVKSIPVERWGPVIERDARFPDRVNIEFVEIVKPGEIVERTWERGAGETQSCGSGACAAAVVTISTGRSNRSVRVRQAGGTLDVAWEPGGDLYLTGPAVVAFSGEWALEIPAPRA